MAAVLRLTSLTELDLRDNSLRDKDQHSLLEGLKDSGITTLLLGEQCSADFRTIMDETVKENRERCFLLQMQAEATGAAFDLTFHTAAGNVAAVISWPPDRPVQELPGALLSRLRSSGGP